MSRNDLNNHQEANSRRMELIRAAAKLFRDQGYERTTVRDLGNAVGLQSGSLFYHFRTKEEILVAVMALGITATTEQLALALATAPDIRSKLAALFHVHLHSLLGDNQAALEVAAQGLIKQDTHLLRRTLLGSLHWTVQWYRNDGELSVAQLADRMLALTLQQG